MGVELTWEGLDPRDSQPQPQRGKGCWTGGRGLARAQQLWCSHQSPSEFKGDLSTSDVAGTEENPTVQAKWGRVRVQGPAAEGGLVPSTALTSSGYREETTLTVPTQMLL